MDKIVPNLLRIYKNRTVIPIIAQARHDRFEEVRVQLKEIVPVHLLEPAIRTFLPRVVRVFEVPITKWKKLPEFNMIATVLTPNLVEEVAQWKTIEKIYPDYIKYALAPQYPVVPEAGVFYDYRKEAFTTTYWVKKLLGLDRANTKGFNGKGIRTVVADTGCEVKLPQVRHVKALTAMAEKGGVGVSDSNGHGTHVVSTVGGKPEVDMRYNAPVEGMAPEADLYSIQCLGFIIGIGMTSDVLQAMETALKLGAKIVSMSLGSEDSPPDDENPEAVAVNKLTENGILVCVAAGNAGPGPETVGSPGSCLNSLTVGAIDPLTGEIADFSSRGPTKGDRAIKPDICSYGVRLNSQTTGLIDRMVDPSQKWYAPISGTSMSTPTVAGFVTCLAQLYREKLGKELTVDEVKRMAEALGHPKSNDDGFGLLDWAMVEEWVSTTYGITL